jgi:hypothetical protein
MFMTYQIKFYMSRFNVSLVNVTNEKLNNYKELDLLRCNAVQFGVRQPTFRRNILLPSSG